MQSRVRLQQSKMKQQHANIYLDPGDVREKLQAEVSQVRRAVHRGHSFHHPRQEQGTEKRTNHTDTHVEAHGIITASKDKAGHQQRKKHIVRKKEDVQVKQCKCVKDQPSGKPVNEDRMLGE